MAEINWALLKNNFEKSVSSKIISDIPQEYYLFGTLVVFSSFMFVFMFEYTHKLMFNYDGYVLNKVFIWIKIMINSGSAQYMPAAISKPK